ncbi:uncharacterized protein LOC120290621 [Eucalyptus grandis]|uniref:uncharacterized protein LOC120290621 n=1 Tax=Eucalyptus grandis TaxID=71139 RepID=UPI00192EEE3D|nr:uncharacterized protein LOC120290621 [Eucalyptus grandis]
MNKKHYPQSLSDEVCRLQKIAKDGTLHKCMTSRGTNTVQDFLQLYLEMGSPSGHGRRLSNMPARVINDDKMYFCQALNKASIVFNSVMKVAQAALDGQIYQSVDTLAHSQKILLQNLKWLAYNNNNQWCRSMPYPTFFSESRVGVKENFYGGKFLVIMHDSETLASFCRNSKGKQVVAPDARGTPQASRERSKGPLKLKVFSEDKKVSFASRYLEGEVEHWWEGMRPTLGDRGGAIAWEDFKQPSTKGERGSG